MIDPYIEEQRQPVSGGEINYESQRILIDDIDENGYVMYDEKESEYREINSGHEHTLIDDIENDGDEVEDQQGLRGEINDNPHHMFDNDGLNQCEQYESVSTNVFQSIVGLSFVDSDIAYNFYNEYGLSRGFGIRKHYHKKHSGTNEIYRHIFVCNKEGFKDMKRTTNDGNRRCIKRTGCNAMIQVTLSKQGKWVVDKFKDEHNHPFDNLSHVPRQWSHKVFHRSKECKDLVILLSKAGIRPGQITKIVNAYRGNQEDKLTRVECSTIVSGERKINLGRECHGIITHFQKKVETDKDFYFAIDLNTDGTLSNVFWADGRSRLSYNHFGDVVVFDVTYKTNTFSLPFAPFVGVNHHGQTILFGAALLENESETTFKWLFEQFLKCMYGCPPISIITDQDLAMGKVIGKVFPKTRHRYCAWHIKKHVLEHLQPSRSRYDDFEDTYIEWV